MAKVTLYSTGCPRCNVLTAKLKQHNIEYDLVDDQDKMAEMGIMSVPVLEKDGKKMAFGEAVEWLNDMED